MKPLARNTAIVLTTAVVFVSSQAHATVGEDHTFSGARVSPTHRFSFCLGDHCMSPGHLFGATQHPDGNQAGSANPTKIDESANHLFGGFKGSRIWFGDADWEIGNRLSLPQQRRNENYFRGSYPRFRDYVFGGTPSGPVDSANPELGADHEVRGKWIGFDFELWDEKPRRFTTWSDRILDEFLRSDAAWQGLNYQPDPPQYMIFPPGDDLGIFSWPAPNMGYSDFGADRDPIKGTVGMGATTFEERVQEASEAVRPGSSFDRVDFETPVDGLAPRTFEERVQEAIEAVRPGSSIGSFNFETPADGLISPLGFYVNQQLDFNGTQYTSLMFDEYDRGLVINLLDFAGITVFEINGCRVVLVPTDPNYQRTGRHGGGSWGQAEDDQWAIKRAGYTDDEHSAWNRVPETASPVVVAVIDTGLDWHHLDISHENIWRNENEIPDNGIDDDDNGYVDDLIGWDFFARNNRPWDFDGHGTVVTGIIAATQNNDAGIAGINPHARIMVLKAVNNFGTTRASYLAEAIVYAADNGARVINISVGGPHSSRMEQAAIDYAHEKGVLVVAAAGNDGVELDDFGPGGGDHVLTVGATHTDNRTAAFSNFGEKVDLVAPGVDVLSLRARYTDANYRPANGGDYVVGTNYVGEDKRYLHVSGTSFSAPIVAATASLLLAKNPELTAAQVEHILVQTAKDVDFPGKDQYAGHGMLDAQMALSVEPDFFVQAEITAVQFVTSESGTVANVIGTIDASSFKRAWMQMGAGENPGAWKFVGQKRKYPIHEGRLGTISVSEFRGNELWQVVINVEDRNGVVKRTAFPVSVDN